MTSVFDCRINFIDGSSDLMAAVAGKVCLFVNIASKAGYQPLCSPIWSHIRTTRHLWELEKVHQKYKHQNFSVVGFPCNQFHAMEPLENSLIIQHMKNNYPFVTFPISEKIDVNGENEHPIYAALKGNETRRVDDNPADTSAIAIKNRNLAGQALSRVHGNYEKFIVTSQGAIVYRFNNKHWPLSQAALTNESDMTIMSAIESLLT